MENERNTETLEVDSNGGWLITHHTKTWDTRVPLTQLKDKLTEAQAIQADANQKVADIQAKVTEFDAEIAQAQQKEKAQADAGQLLDNPQ